MTAFFVATSIIKDAEKFQEYGGKATASLAAFDAKLVIKGKAEKTIAGNSDHQVVAVARFADMETLDNWFNSAEYQALIPLRDEAVDMTLVAYSVPQ